MDHRFGRFDILPKLRFLPLRGSSIRTRLIKLQFKPKIEFSFSRGHYEVKTVATPQELEDCLKLRYQVFHVEYRQKRAGAGFDVDSFDRLCDHLVIIDRRDNRVIGTYRLNSSLVNDRFYSSEEFELDEILALPLRKLEMGRACIDQENRNGVVIALLWRGIAEYIQRSGTQLLFGCGSIKTTDAMEAAKLSKFFRDEGYCTDRFAIDPTRKYRMPGLQEAQALLEKKPELYSRDEIKTLVPSLVKSYFMAGAKACPTPALDREFGCIDFLTVLLIDELNPSYRDKYKV